MVLSHFFSVCVDSDFSLVSLLRPSFFAVSYPIDNSQFALLATSLQETLETRFVNLAAASRTCVNYISADANRAYENSPFFSFPFVTLPHFELYAQEARARAEIEALLFVPVVPDGSLAEMNFYMSENQNTWVQQARTTAGSDETTPYDFAPAIFDVLPFDTIAVTGGAGPYLPIWQWSPPPEGAAPLPVGKQNLAASPDDNALLQASAAARGTSMCPLHVSMDPTCYCCMILTHLTLFYFLWYDRLCPGSHADRVRHHGDTFAGCRP
jgi:hypothetical protein